MKKKLKVLALFDAVRPTKIDQDLSKEMKTEDWKTEKEVFAAPPGPGRITAAVSLRRRRRRLLNSVCQWTNEKKFRVNKLLSRLIDRCDQLDLCVLNDDPQQDFRVTSFITTLVMNYLFTGKFKRTK